jgi:hypothetical protein
VIGANSNEGLKVTVDGAPARLAVVTADGSILDGDAIAQEAFAVSVNAYRDFLRAQGHLRVWSRPGRPEDI